MNRCDNLSVGIHQRPSCIQGTVYLRSLPKAGSIRTCHKQLEAVGRGSLCRKFIQKNHSKVPNHLELYLDVFEWFFEWIYLDVFGTFECLLDLFGTSKCIQKCYLDLFGTFLNLYLDSSLCLAFFPPLAPPRRMVVILHRDTPQGTVIKTIT